MKKTLIIILATLLINLSAAPCFSAAEIGEAMKILPESTDFVIKFSSAKEFYDYFSVTDKSFWGNPIEDIEQIKEDLGFNPFDLKELQSNGFDITKPLGVAVSDFKIMNGDDTPHMNIMILLPIKDEKKAVAKIKEFVENENPDAKFAKNGDIWSWYFDIDSSEPEDLEDSHKNDDTQTETDEAQPADAQAEEQNEDAPSENQVSETANTPSIPSYMISKNGYLFLGTNPMVDSRQFFENLAKDGEKLIAAPTFINVIDKVNPTKEFFLYANLGRIFQANPQAMQYLKPAVAGAAENENGKDYSSKEYPGLNYLKDYQGAGVSADLKSSDFKANFVLNIVENSPALNLFKGVIPKRDLVLGLKEKPLLLTGVVENFQIYWKMIQETLNKESLSAIKKDFSRVKTDYNIDVEKDLIDNLGSNVSLGVYDAISINMANINTLAALEFKNPVKIKEAIEKIITKLPPEQQSMINRIQINGSEVYMMPVGPVQIYAGFIGNDFVITLGKPMFEKAMTANAKSGFMEGFKDQELRKSLQQDISILFFDVNEAMYTVKNFVPLLAYANPESQIMMTPQFKKIMEPFDYVSAASRIDGNAMVGEFLFKSKFNKPFFQGIKDVTEQINTLKKNMNLAQPPVVDPSVTQPSE
ncbi:MAG: hypothetical protein HQK62_07150 [Desulfamplus sp.]|nr:hypothetical protein [Desulfamplus sp.]